MLVLGLDQWRGRSGADYGQLTNNGTDCFFIRCKFLVIHTRNEFLNSPGGIKHVLYEKTVTFHIAVGLQPIPHRENIY